MASSTQQQLQPGATPAALRIQILATEHWSLLATRSQTWNESFARAQMLLSMLAASVIALPLVAQATGFGSGSTAFALVLLPVVLFLGLTTYIGHRRLGDLPDPVRLCHDPGDGRRHRPRGRRRDRCTGTRALGLQAPLAAALGVLVAAAVSLALTVYARWAYRR